MGRDVQLRRARRELVRKLSITNAIIAADREALLDHDAW